MKKSFSRGTALVAGTAMLLINGVVYAWSIYSSPFVEGFGWSSAKLGVCFTVMLGSFCLGGRSLERLALGILKRGAKLVELGRLRVDLLHRQKTARTVDTTLQYSALVIGGIVTVHVHDDLRADL